ERERAEQALRKTEDQLRHAQKMEAVGRLAGGIAHDFNNILSVILSYAEILDDAIGAEDPNLRDVREIQTAGKKAAALTKQLLAFSRQQVVEPRALDLRKLIEAMLNMLQRLLGADV